MHVGSMRGNARRVCVVCPGSAVKTDSVAGGALHRKHRKPEIGSTLARRATSCVVGVWQSG